MNPFQQWLGISASNQPNHFELLGLSIDENNSKAIEEAARSQLRKLKKHRTGEHAKLCEEIANQVKRAYRELKTHEQRVRYRETLQNQTRTEPARRKSVVYIDDEYAHPFVIWQFACGALTTIALALVVAYWLIYGSLF